MCIETNEAAMDYNKKSTSYSIKKVLKALFNKNKNQNKNSNKKTTSLESLESLDNLRNSQFEEHYEEIEENTANEKLLSFMYNEATLQESNSFEQNHKGDDDEEDIFIPVRFARTEVGTFFWTTNLQPAAIITTITTPHGDDMDLIQPAYCYTSCQYPELQFQDRWAQA